jgi:putative membrane protein
MEHDRLEVGATASNHFAWLRTRLALERTLMAWVRTGSSLIGFGFTIVTFFDRLQEIGNDREVQHPALAEIDLSRWLGEGLIFIGGGERRGGS